MDRYTRHHDGRFAKPGEAVSAADLHREKQGELAARRAGSSKGGTAMTLHTLSAAYLAHLERKGSDPKTRARNEYALARYEAWLATLGISPVKATETVIEEYFAWLSCGCAQTTANREAAMVKAAYRYAKRLGMIEENPAEYVRAPRVDDVEPEVYSNEELRRIRSAIRDDLDEAIFYGFAYEGLRRFELVSLGWTKEADPANYVDLEKQELTVRGKGGRLRRVPIHPLFAEILAPRRERLRSEGTVLGKGGSLRNVNERLERMLRRARVAGGNRPAHKFRKTVQTVLYEEGVRTDVIDKMLGWAPSSVRQRYYSRVRDQAMYEGILRLYVSDPIERSPLGPPGEVTEASRQPTLARVPSQVQRAAPGAHASHTREDERRREIA
jgi:integrase